jgi:hypothetical protein
MSGAAAMHEFAITAMAIVLHAPAARNFLQCRTSNRSVQPPSPGSQAPLRGRAKSKAHVGSSQITKLAPDSFRGCPPCVIARCVLGRSICEARGCCRATKSASRRARRCAWRLPATGSRRVRAQSPRLSRVRNNRRCRGSAQPARAAGPSWLHAPPWSWRTG